jgi:(heptosyl)LPS beta-1,4-glucosyltransferase
MTKISVVINTLNEEKRLPRALASIKNFADEVIVCDMKSQDDTRAIARQFGAKVFEIESKGYVEPARNFAISKADGEWILVLDADEELSADLAKKLKKISESEDSVDYYRIPRKNMIFGKWMKHTFWWPDYNIRFFKKGFVSWSEIIHSVPTTTGKGSDLEASEENALTHWHYSNINQYLERMIRYTDIQLKNLTDKGVKFSWKDILTKPNSEFLRRYFSEEGYKDGLHGLALSSLQAFSELVLYLKLWEKQKYEEQSVELQSYELLKTKAEKESMWWIYNIKAHNADSFVNKIWLKIQKNLRYR